MSISKEELREFLNDSENQDLLVELAKEKGFKTDDEITGLKNKNLEILSEKKELKKKYDELKKTIDSVDIDEYNLLKEQVENSQGKDQKVTKLERDFKRLEEQLKKEQEQKNEVAKKYRSTLKKIKIVEALDNNNIDPQHKDIILSAFSGRAEVEEDGEVLITNGGGLGQPVNEFFEQWVAEDGKRYLKEAQSTGTKSNDGNPTKHSKTIKRSDFEGMNPQQQAKIATDQTVKIID